jgi:hypothetical protein
MLLLHTAGMGYDLYEGLGVKWDVVLARAAMTAA